MTFADTMASCHYSGDNYCDDETNMAECSFDGGDCCMEPANCEFCTECTCVEKNAPASCPQGDLSGAVLVG